MTEYAPRDTTDETITLRGKLTCLFYKLIRDLMPAGDLVTLVDEVKELKTARAAYCSPAMLQLSQELAGAVVGDPTSEQEQITFLEERLERSNILVCALMGMLDDPTEVNFEDKQLAAIYDSRRSAVITQWKKSDGTAMTTLRMDWGKPVIMTEEDE